MRRDWCNHETLDIGHENRPAGCEVICCGTGWSRNHQTVSLISRHKNLVYINVAMVEACDRSFPDHYIVERVKTRDTRCPARHLTVHHGTGIDIVGPTINAFQGGIKVLNRYFCEEAQRAQVHADYRNPGLRNCPCRGEEGSVPTKDDHKIEGARPHLFAGNDHRSISMRPGLGIDNKCVVVNAKPFHQLGNNSYDFWLVRLRDDTNGFLRWSGFSHVEDGIVQKCQRRARGSSSFVILRVPCGYRFSLSTAKDTKVPEGTSEPCIQQELAVS